MSDWRALGAILAGEDEAAPVVDLTLIPPVSEADALKQDIQALPGVPLADDCEHVHISAFRAAMQRGVGWTESAVASTSDKRRKNGLTELYLPQARPSLLGINAKQRELEDDRGGKKKPRVRTFAFVMSVSQTKRREWVK